jgi:outer membrane lipoprotein SlyB
LHCPDQPARPESPGSTPAADKEDGRKPMRTPKPVLPILAALALIATVPACAPANTGTTVSRAGLGSAASVSFGTIVGTRPVQVQGSGGVGTLAGAAAGGLAGSFVGGDWRSNALAGIGGAIVGGLAGSAVERGVTGGTAIEFIVREDRGGDIAVVQTNEEGLQVGDRVVVTRGDRVRLSRAADGPPGVTGAAPAGATTVAGPGPAK